MIGLRSNLTVKFCLVLSSFLKNAMKRPYPCSLILCPALSKLDLSSQLPASGATTGTYGLHVDQFHQ